MPVRSQFSSDEEHLKALRSWFAGMALQGMMSSSDKFSTGERAAQTPEDFGSLAFMYADAMLEASKK